MPSPPTAPAELFRSLGEGFDSVGAGWYVFGAQAVLIWGRPRLTADIDVTVRLDPEAPDRLVDALTSRGLQLRVSPSDRFVARTRVLPFVHPSTGLLVDVVLGGPGLEDLFLSRAVTVDVGGVPVRVISAEDLVVTKILAGRPKDLDDIDGVIRERGTSLDLAAIRATLTELERGLGQSDLLPAFESALARVQGKSPQSE